MTKANMTFSIDISNKTLAQQSGLNMSSIVNNYLTNFFQSEVNYEKGEINELKQKIEELKQEQAFHRNKMADIGTDISVLQTKYDELMKQKKIDNEKEIKQKCAMVDAILNTGILTDQPMR